MKVLIVSDIHGSLDSALAIQRIFEEEKCEKIICLGDVLYHGPRNDLPPQYKPKEVIAILNQYADQIICVQGNCDAEVDQMVLNFPILPFYDATINDKTCHFEHGHHLKMDGHVAQMVFFGHTHIPQMEEKNDTIYWNPGSITLPKNGSKRSYLIWENHLITLKDIDGNELFSFHYE